MTVLSGLVTDAPLWQDWQRRVQVAARWAFEIDEWDGFLAEMDTCTCGGMCSVGLSCGWG